MLSVINLVAVGFAAGSADPWHATGHTALALAFGLWAQRLHPGPGGSERQARLEGLEAEMSNRLEGLEAEVSSLGGELGDTQERLDFAERLLAQRPEARGVGPERWGPKQSHIADR